MNSEGSSSPRSGCCQRTNASTPSNAAAVDVDDGLVVQDQLTGVDAEPELSLDVDPFHRLSTHLTVEQRHPVAAQVLGLVHRDVCVADECPGVDRGPTRQRDADARGDLDGVRLVADRLSRGSHHPAADAHGVVGPADPFAEHGELVAAQPGDRVARTDDALQPDRHGAQQAVAPFVPEGVVDRLEVVEVEEQDSDRLVGAPQLVERHLQAIHEEVPVGQPGQLVVRRLIAEQLAGDVLVGDVLHDAADADDRAVRVGHGRKARDEVGRQVGVTRAWDLHPLTRHTGLDDLTQERAHGRPDTHDVFAREPGVGLGRPRGQLREGLVDPEEPAVQTPHGQGDRCRVEDGRQQVRRRLWAGRLGIPLRRVSVSCAAVSSACIRTSPVRLRRYDAQR